MLSLTLSANPSCTMRYQRYDKLMLGVRRDKRIMSVGVILNGQADPLDVLLHMHTKSIAGILLMMSSMSAIILGNSLLRR